MKFYPYEKGGGGGTCFSHAEGDAKSFHPLKWGAQKVLPCLEGEHKKFWTRDFPILCPPPPIPPELINSPLLSFVSNV